MNQGLVSIIIPTYNYARYLPEAIRSCLDQSYKDIEIVVIDDGSTDDTRAIAAQYQSVIYVYQENQGVSIARNRGLHLARGEYVGFLDADDRLTSDAIETRLAAFDKYRHVVAVFTETWSQKEPNAPLSPPKPQLRNETVSDRFYEKLLTRKFPFATCSVLMKSELAKRFTFPPEVANGEDIAYFTKIFFSGPACYLSKPTAITLRHTDSLRHDIHEIEKNGLALASVIFDDDLYRGALDHLATDFISFRCLSFFRRLFLAGRMEAARQYYLKAVSLRPSNLLKVDYLVKFVRSYRAKPSA